VVLGSYHFGRPHGVYWTPSRPAPRDRFSEKVGASVRVARKRAWTSSNGLTALSRRIVRAGYLAVWAQGAYVYRHPATPRRQREETRRFEASRRRYQDTFCGERLAGERRTYARHCRGEACPWFALPAARSL